MIRIVQLHLSTSTSPEAEYPPSHSKQIKIISCNEKKNSKLLGKLVIMVVMFVFEMKSTINGKL